MALAWVVGIIVGVVAVAAIALVPFFLVLFLGERALDRLPLGRPGRFFLILVKSLRRNLLRTSLTYLATFVLVVVVTMVWSTLYYLDNITKDKSKDLKVIVSEKWQQWGGAMPYSYAPPLSEGAADPSRPGDVRPQDSMTWQYYIGTIDPDKKARENQLFFLAVEPRKVLSILDDLFEDLRADEAKGNDKVRPDQLKLVEQYVAMMEGHRQAAIVGIKVLEKINKRVGERIRVTGIYPKDLDLEFEIAGVFPQARYAELCVMHRDYFNDSLDAYPKTHGGQKHPMANKSLNLVWLRVGNQDEFGKVAGQIDSSSLFRDPAVKCQTLSSGVAPFIDAYKDLIWGMRWLLSPAILVTMSLVLASAISISVRERRTEMAVLKVLGFRPAQVMALVLGEATLIGAVSGLLSAAVTYVMIDHAVGPYVPEMVIYVPLDALWWGPLIGAVTALAGSFAPAWSARTVRASEVFAKVA